jgi:hypothetical protein
MGWNRYATMNTTMTRNSSNAFATAIAAYIGALRGHADTAARRRDGRIEPIEREHAALDFSPVRAWRNEFALAEIGETPRPQADDGNPRPRLRVLQGMLSFLRRTPRIRQLDSVTAKKPRRKVFGRYTGNGSGRSRIARPDRLA